MFSINWDNLTPKNKLTYTSGQMFSDRDDHPFRFLSEGFVVDPTPLPEDTSTVKQSNVQQLFNRSYIEAVTIGIGSIAVLAMIVKYSRK